MRFLVLLVGLLFGSSLVQASELLNIINQERAKRGLSQLKEKSELVCAATKHSKDIGSRRVCTHTGRDGSNPGTRIAACGLKSMGWGEIVACGQRTPRAAVDAWIRSPGHAAIMFSRSYTYFGDGMLNYYWTVAFSR